MTARQAGALVFTMALVAGVCEGIYAALGTTPPFAYTLAYWAAFWWLMTLWLLADSRERGLPVLFDEGMFVLALWPILVPVHMVRTRGWTGLGWVAAAVMVLYASYLMTYTIVGLVANAVG